MACIH